MENFGTELWLLTAAAGVIMTLTFLRAVGQGSVAIASGFIDERRALEAKRKEENAAAEAAGRAAALEPLNLNADGSIEEPIMGVVEKQAA